MSLNTSELNNEKKSCLDMLQYLRDSINDDGYKYIHLKYPFRMDKCAEVREFIKKSEDNLPVKIHFKDINGCDWNYTKQYDNIKKITHLKFKNL